jgi:peptide/nickel transport system ATP-binding protein/oligopeptide transport system ATP-binding protein
MSILLDISDLAVRFETRRGFVHAVNGVSYTLEKGETLGIVGESGSGKSVHFLAALGLLPPTVKRQITGRVVFDGKDLLTLSEEELSEIRGRDIGVVFQDPMSALNPVLTVGRQLREVLMRHQPQSKAKAQARAIELLDLVGIPEPERRVNEYPHQFSGGMRQRVMIAIAISCQPKLLIADEATTALDVTVQAQIVDLVRDLSQKMDMSVIWITHDLGVLAGIADQVQVMYGGRVMERGPVDAIFDNPRNAYTRGLLSSIPSLDENETKRLYQIPGSPPDLTKPPVGDPFAPRNPDATERCFAEMPPLRAVENSPGHVVAAWYELAPCMEGHR